MEARVVYPCLQRLLYEARSTCSEAFGDDAFDTAFAEGATLSITDAAEYSRRLRVTHATTQVGWDALTPTEARVAELVAEGLANAQVGKELLMGAETVKTHWSWVFGNPPNVIADRIREPLTASHRGIPRQPVMRSRSTRSDSPVDTTGTIMQVEAGRFFDSD